MKLMNIWMLAVCSFITMASTCLQAHRGSGSHREENNVADYVVIGVGTAGGLMTKRLSDDKKSSVIALHNGENLTQDRLIKYSKNAKFVLAALLGTPNPFANIPNIPPDIAKELAALFGGSNTSNVPFLYQTGVSTPQLDADNRLIPWQLVLPEGGASSINAGAWCRGTNAVYSQWDTIAGPEWSANRILDIYKELEHYHGKTPNPYQRGYHGPVSVLQAKHPSKLSKKFTKAIIRDAQCFQSHCLMAPQAQGGVVDNTGHVYGVQNLIVADNSIVPIPMDGTTMATGYLIAANIARLLGH